MKTDLALYPFGQCPRYQDDEVDMCQSNSILRHLGRKHALYGQTEQDMVNVDMLLDGVESIKLKYLNLIYVDQLQDGPKEVFWSAHCDPLTTSARNAGAHFSYLANLIARTGDAFAVGSSLTVADIAIFDMVDMMLRIFGAKFEQIHPELTALHSKVAALPGIAAYLASGRRPEQQNGVPLG
jgi:glutathione S-transferase P